MGGCLVSEPARPAASQSPYEVWGGIVQMLYLIRRPRNEKVNGNNKNPYCSGAGMRFRGKGFFSFFLFVLFFLVFNSLYFRCSCYNHLSLKPNIISLMGHTLLF